MVFLASTGSCGEAQILIAAALGGLGTRCLTITGRQQILLQFVPLGLIQHPLLAGGWNIMHGKILGRGRWPRRRIGGQP